MREFRLSIDYGTTNTVAYLRPPEGRAFPLMFDGQPLLPSAVYAEPDGRLLTGTRAINSARLEPDRYEPNPKRRIHDGTVLLGRAEFRVADLIGATLGRVLAEARTYTGDAPVRVVLTYPAGWRKARRDVLLAAARQAGIHAPTLVTEPEAAAAYLVASGESVPDGVPLIVYDLGAGTCDVSAVLRSGRRFDALDCQGLEDVGGLDLDEIVVELAGRSVGRTHPDEWTRLRHPDDEDRRYVRVLREEARLAKERLSVDRSTRMHIPLADTDVQVTRGDFDRDARRLLARTVEMTVKVLRKASIGPDDPARLFLVGGATRTPLVATVLAQATRREPQQVEHPEQIVAAGALCHIAIAAGEDVRAVTPPPQPQPQGSPQPQPQAQPVPDPRPAPDPQPTLRDTIPQTRPMPVPETRPIPVQPAAEDATVRAPMPAPVLAPPPNRRKFVPNPQRHLRSTMIAGAVFGVTALALAGLDAGLLLRTALLVVLLGAGLGLAVKIFDWVRCARDTRPLVIDPSGVQVTGPAGEALFRWDDIAAVYLRRHAGSRWLVCTPADGSRLAADPRTVRYWDRSYGLFLLTSVSGFPEEGLREALVQYSGSRFKL